MTEAQSVIEDFLMTTWAVGQELTPQAKTDMIRSIATANLKMKTGEAVMKAARNILRIREAVQRRNVAQELKSIMKDPLG